MMTMMGRKRDWAGVLLFFFPFISLITRSGVSVSSFAFLFGVLVLWSDARAALARHWSDVRPVLLAFFAYALFALACVLLRADFPLSSFEKPVRMLFGATALLLVLVARPDRAMLWRGVGAGLLAGLCLIAYERFGLDVERPGGPLNPITFGDLSLCLGLIALAGVVDARRARDVAWAAGVALAGLAGSVITGSRGGWFAVAFAALLFARYARMVRARLLLALVVVACALLAGSYFVPQTGVRERVAEGVADVDTYFDGSLVYTHIGVRLELWRGALMLIAEHPLLGVSIPAYKARMDQYGAEGKIDRRALQVLRDHHFHNDALQTLVTGGALGFLAWLGILLAPLRFFMRMLARQRAPGGALFAPALAGMLVVLCYVSFGLTEVIFWSVEACMFYALMIFLLMGLCLNAKEDDGK